MKTCFVSLLFTPVLLFLFNSSTHAQNPEWINYTTGSPIYDLVDGGDDMWIATLGGLVRFNKVSENLTFYNHANAGLPENYLLAVAIDSSKNVWVGTHYAGVGRFIDRTFTVFQRVDLGLPIEYWNYGIAVDPKGKVWINTFRYLTVYGDSVLKRYEIAPSIMSFAAVWDFDFDKKGNVWIGTTEGLGKISGDSLKKRYAGIWSDVRALARDRNDTLWTGTYSKGLMRLDGETLTIFDTTNSGIPSNTILDMEFDANGNLWLATFKGLVRFDGNKWTTYNTHNSPLDGSAIPSVEIDAKGVIWVATASDTLYRFNGHEWKGIKLSNSGLVHNLVSSFAVDARGNRWISCYNQLIRFDGLKWEYFDTTNVQLLNSYLDPIYQRSTRTIWVGPNVLISYESSGKWKVYGGNPYRGGKIKVDKGGNIWEATNQGLWKFDGKTWMVYDTASSTIPSNSIARVALDDHSNVWLSTYASTQQSVGGKLIKFDGANWTTYYTCDPGNWISGFGISSAGNIWIGLYSGGVHSGLRKFDGKQWTSYYPNDPTQSGGSINTLCLDKDEHVWIATNGSGLITFDGKNSWTVYKKENSGLPDNNVESLDIDALGNKWLQVNLNGLAVFREGGVIITDVEEIPSPPLPQSVLLSQNYPNPFNPTTTIEFSVGIHGRTSLRVFNVLGREVATIVNGEVKAGNYQVKWDATGLPSGIYFYRLETGAYRETRKLVLLK